MTDNTDQPSIVSTLRASLPADLTAVVLVTMATVAAVGIPVINTTPIRVILATPFVLFIPGYALVAALFPEENGISGMERLALAFGTSIAIVPILGLILNSTPFGIRLEPVLLFVSGVTLGLTYIATYRRLQLPADDRLVVPFRRWIQSVITVFSGHESRRDSVLTVVALVSVLLAVSSVGYAFAVPQQADAFTEFYIVTEQDDGELVADDYPTEFTVGESQPIIVGIGNREHQLTEYTLVVELQEVTVENDSTTVHESDELLRRQPTVATEETSHEEVEITPEMEGDRLRLTFMLFKNDAPAEPTIDNAYRETHLWINVSAGD